MDAYITLYVLIIQGGICLCQSSAHTLYWGLDSNGVWIYKMDLQNWCTDACSLSAHLSIWNDLTQTGTTIAGLCSRGRRWTADRGDRIIPVEHKVYRQVDKPVLVFKVHFGKGGRANIPLASPYITSHAMFLIVSQWRVLLVYFSSFPFVNLWSP